MDTANIVMAAHVLQIIKAQPFLTSRISSAPDSEEYFLCRSPGKDFFSVFPASASPDLIAV
jgi:hypothetical protein